MIKTLLLFVLATIIIFFVWNILKRIFFTLFYQSPQQNETIKKNKKTINQKVNWDAETVDYEEIKELKNGEK